ncbi:MAG TPA: C2H2-type zinc finger protein [Thermoplasmata archaeon]|nr:C2H2-type zinc finger protein [Thermoplasmata archaeon]
MPYVEYDEVEAACSDCGRLFRSEEALAAHRSEAHAPDSKSAPIRVAPVTCAVCHRRLASVSALARHNRSAHTS